MHFTQRLRVPKDDGEYYLPQKSLFQHKSLLYVISDTAQIRIYSQEHESLRLEKRITLEHGSLFRGIGFSVRNFIYYTYAKESRLFLVGINPIVDNTKGYVKLFLQDDWGNFTDFVIAGSRMVILRGTSQAQLYDLSYYLTKPRYLYDLPYLEGYEF